jgi:hypothetical protein
MYNVIPTHLHSQVPAKVAAKKTNPKASVMDDNDDNDDKAASGEEEDELSKCVICYVRREIYIFQFRAYDETQDISLVVGEEG